MQGDPYKEGAAPRRRPPTASQDLAGRSADDFGLGDGGFLGGRCFQGESFEDVSVASSFDAANDVGVGEVGHSGLDGFRIAVCYRKTLYSCFLQFLASSDYLFTVLQRAGHSWGHYRRFSSRPLVVEPSPHSGGAWLLISLDLTLGGPGS